MILHKSLCLEVNDQLVLLAERRADYETFETTLLQLNLQPQSA